MKKILQIIKDAFTPVWHYDGKKKSKVILKIGDTKVGEIDAEEFNKNISIRMESVKTEGNLITEAKLVGASIGVK